MAANDYYNHASQGKSGRAHNYNAPLPPLPTSSPSYPTAKQSQSPTSPFDDSTYPSYPQRSQTSFASDSAYYGARQGGRVEESSTFADDRPLRPQTQKKPSDDWVPHSQQQYRLDDVGDAAERGKGGKGSRSRGKRRRGFFTGQIPWVVYILTVVQVGVFIGEIVKNGR